MERWPRLEARASTKGTLLPSRKRGTERRGPGCRPENARRVTRGRGDRSCEENTFPLLAREGGAVDPSPKRRRSERKLALVEEGSGGVRSGEKGY